MLNVLLVTDDVGAKGAGENQSSYYTKLIAAFPPFGHNFKFNYT